MKLCLFVFILALKIWFVKTDYVNTAFLDGPKKQNNPRLTTAFFSTIRDPIYIINSSVLESAKNPNNYMPDIWADKLNTDDYKKIVGVLLTLQQSVWIIALQRTSCDTEFKSEINQWFVKPVSWWTNNECKEIFIVDILGQMPNIDIEVIMQQEFEFYYTAEQPKVWQNDTKLPMISKAALLYSNSYYDTNIPAYFGNFPKYGRDFSTLDTVIYRFRYIAFGLTRSGCREGYFAKSLVKSKLNMPIENAVFEKCKFGTFNTCENDDECFFHAQMVNESAESWRSKIKWQYGDDINIVLKVNKTLVGSCYPCEYGVMVFRHYGFLGVSKYGYNASKFGNAIDFYCPGGKEPPTPCPANSQAFVDKDGIASGCTCRAGTYDPNDEAARTANTASNCILCPAGYYCVQGKKTLCSVGQYSRAGAFECIECTKSPCEIPELVRPVCPAGSTEDKTRCIPCSQCANYGSPDRNAVDCYGAFANFSARITISVT